MLGRMGLDETLVGFVQSHAPRTPLASWPVQSTVSFLQKTLAETDSRRARIHVVGTRGSGRRTFAAAVCAQLNFPLLVIDTDAIDEAGWRRIYLHAQRHAYLTGCALAWTGENLARRSWPQGITPFPMQFMIVEPGQDLPSDADAAERTVVLPTNNARERGTLWQEHLPATKSWPKKSFHELAEQHHFQPAEIASAGRAGPENPQQAVRFAREASRTRLGQLAQRIECPFTMDDLVVSKPLSAALEDIEYEARSRHGFWERTDAQRLFPQGRGLLALFSGPPGTGKTMGAQVLAARLNYDLYRINLATVVSKWVGETSQNLDRILTRAKAENLPPSVIADRMAEERVKNAGR